LPGCGNALVVDNDVDTAEELSAKRAAYLEVKTELTMPYYRDFINGTGDRPFDERYDELLRVLDRVEESATILDEDGRTVEDNNLVDSLMCPNFVSLLESKYTSMYVVFCCGMEEKYPLGRSVRLYCGDR